MNDKETMQKAFDTAVNGIIAQGSQSTLSDDATTCAYRGDGGKKCAVGFLISDDQIIDYLIKEGSTPHDFPSDLIAEILPGVRTGDATTFLDELQSVHDNCSSMNFISDFKSRANEFALKWDLRGI